MPVRGTATERRPALPAEGACARAAMRLLRARGHPASSIEAVHPFAVTFCDQAGRVMTAWTVWDDEVQRLEITVEEGLPAFPS